MTTDMETIETHIVRMDAPRAVAWQQDALDLFRNRMLSRQQLFPCVFGVDAVRRGTLRASFIEHGNAESLAASLGEFAGVAEVLGRRTSLVVFVAHEKGADTARRKDMRYYQNAFWKLLQDVHALDETPWPHDIPMDTSDPQFEFSFGGLPMFVVANTPAHQSRASRYFEYFAITFQPRFVFDDISANSPQGQNARKIIRDRLRNYDITPQTPLLGNFGESGNQEWKQYFLDDDNSDLLEGRSCPFHVRGQVEVVGASTEFTDISAPRVPEGLLDLLPDQGSYEIQSDKPRKTHAWHRHSVDEDLIILSGAALLFWVDGRGEYQERLCTEGTRVSLPAQTVHGSTAGDDGAVYIIRPKDGQVAETEFLAEEDNPYPLPDSATKATAS